MLIFDDRYYKYIIYLTVPPTTSSIVHPALHRPSSETPGIDTARPSAISFSAGILPPPSSSSGQMPSQIPSPALSLSRGEHDRLSLPGLFAYSKIIYYQFIFDVINKF